MLEPVASPCINVCQLDPGGQWCVGCGRSLDEIAEWAGATEQEKIALVRRAKLRMEDLKGSEPPVDSPHTPD